MLGCDKKQCRCIRSSASVSFVQRFLKEKVVKQVLVCVILAVIVSSPVNADAKTNQLAVSAMNLSKYIAEFCVAPLSVGNRKGSKRRGGTNSKGKGSHYVGGRR